ncbi:MAG: MiaB/RimO family radical SAM methylthiotransferase [Phycisphaerales bacterium JB037]
MPGRRVYLETFGCQMNELDSELVAGRLGSLGYQITPDADAADIVLYNTCSVREQAEQKVWSRLGDLKQRKAAEPALVVGVLGCLAERDGPDLIKRMPVVDLMCGPGELDKLPDLLDNAVRTKESLAGSEGGGLRSASQVALQGNTSRRSSTLAAASDDLELLDLSRSVSPTDHKGSAYVRITRGCNKFCTYCVVPFTRGAEIHRPPEHIIDECKKLVDAGVREITLLGQTVNHYRFEHGAAVSLNGITQPQKGRTYKGSHHRDSFAGERVTTFADLLDRIHEEVPGLARLRFVTSYPRDFGNDVLEVIRDRPRLCRYLHVPAQSGSDRMLKMMNRGYTVAEYLEFIDRARHYLDQPEIGRPLMLSGYIIVGFPTETDEDYDATVGLLRTARYKNCFIFKYSPRPGTVAFDRIPDDVPEAVKRARNNHLLSVQAEISDAISREQVGRTFEVFIEGLSKKSLKARGMTKSQIRKAGSVALTVGGRDLDAAADQVDETEPSSREPIQLSGRTDGDLIVFLDCPAGRSPDDLIGSIVPVRITGADRLSLTGEVTD